MPVLTRRRYPERPDCWHVYFGDVQAGTIARRSGSPQHADQWEWRCGFYPGSRPGEHTSGTAPTFEAARAAFARAWAVFLAQRSESDFQAWRDHRDRTARKYALRDSGQRLPPDEWQPGKPASIFMRCPCGTIFNSRALAETVVHVPHLSAVYLWSRVASCLGIVSFMNRLPYRASASLS
jgi:hypothetical protein